MTKKEIFVMLMETGVNFKWQKVREMMVPQTLALSLDMGGSKIECGVKSAAKPN
jgi:hypothetical protein